MQFMLHDSALTLFNRYLFLHHEIDSHFMLRLILTSTLLMRTPLNGSTYRNAFCIVRLSDVTCALYLSAVAELLV